MFISKSKSKRKHVKKTQEYKRAVCYCTAREARAATCGGERTSRTTRVARKTTRRRRAKMGSYDI